MASYHVIIDTTVAETNRRPSTDKILQMLAAKKKTLKYGDIVNFGEDRQSYSYIYVDNSFIKNPDDSGAGYLTIPLSVSQHFPDAVKHYSKVIRKLGVEFGDIELLSTDKTVRRIFKKQNAFSTNAKFSFLPYDNSLVVEVGKKSIPFSVTNISREAIEAAFEPKTKPK